MKKLILLYINILSLTTIYSQNSDSSNYLLFIKKNQHFQYIKEGTNVIVLDSNSNKLKGKLYIVNDSQIVLKNTNTKIDSLINIQHLKFIKYNNHIRKNFAYLYFLGAGVNTVNYFYFDHLSQNKNNLFYAIVYDVYKIINVIAIVPNITVGSILIQNKKAYIRTSRIKKIRLKNRGGKRSQIKEFINYLK